MKNGSASAIRQGAATPSLARPTANISEPPNHATPSRRRQSWSRGRRFVQREWLIASTALAWAPPSRRQGFNDYKWPRFCDESAWWLGGHPARRGACRGEGVFQVIRD